MLFLGFAEEVILENNQIFKTRFTTVILMLKC